MRDLQGDVLRIVDENGTTVATYSYDPYGKVISATGTLAETNPIRYRGYYYDSETGFYYLQSRYYDPAICRFINADSYVSTGQGILGNNMFAYCLGNPIIRVDYRGSDAVVLFDENTPGHIGLLVQDEDGKWWHFYWGSKGFLNRVACALGFNIEAYSWCVEYSGDPLSLDEINTTKQYGGSYEEQFYFSGDFSSIIEELKNPLGKYNLYSKNCSQVSLELLSSANADYEELFKNASEYMLPSSASSYIKNNMKYYGTTNVCYTAYAMAEAARRW